MERGEAVSIAHDTDGQVLEYVSCTLCGTDEPWKLFRVKNDRYLKALGIAPPVAQKVMCRRCGHVYQNPQLNVGQLEKLYKDVYRSVVFGHLQDRPTDEYLYWMGMKARRDYEWLERNVPRTLTPGDALEIGCSAGSFLALMARDGWRVVGVEATPSFAATARKVGGVEIIEALFETVQFDGRLFDVVISLKTLEHVKNPSAFLQRMRRLLRPGGILYLQVPSVLHTSNREDLFESPHLCLFTPSSLHLLLLKNGFLPQTLKEIRNEVDRGLACIAYSTSSLDEEVLAGKPLSAPWTLFLRIQASFWTYRVRLFAHRLSARVRTQIKSALFAMTGLSRGQRIWNGLRHLKSGSDQLGEPSKHRR